MQRQNVVFGWLPYRRRVRRRARRHYQSLNGRNIHAECSSVWRCRRATQGRNSHGRRVERSTMALHNNNKKLDVSGRVHSHQVKHVKNGHVMPFADHAFPVHTFGIELEMGLKDLSLTLTRKSAVTLFSPKQTRPDPYSKPDPTRQYKLPNYNPSLHGNQSLNSPQP